ncbi:DedA family protein [Miniphocaeibacter massiliensis]|uniref:DedA family protein n=1 Tax=Miniphocaeibacter massiliensis TaxID=2041841 RepID=UPI000C0867CB|nr:DedA family protein [Miniphocaeibacter massiliensis]
MESFIIGFLENYGYFGVFLLIFIENLFPPIPSEVILGLGGFFTTSTDLNYFGVVIFATIGSVLGAIILYYIGYYINSDRVKNLLRKGNKILQVKGGKLDKAMEIYKKYASVSVFVCRMIPIIRSIISVPAGMAKMNIGKFIGLTALGSLIWNSIITYLGVYLGDNWIQIEVLIKEYTVIVFGAILIVGLGYIFYRIKKKKKEGKDS